MKTDQVLVSKSELNSLHDFVEGIIGDNGISLWVEALATINNWRSRSPYDSKPSIEEVNTIRHRVDKLENIVYDGKEPCRRDSYD